VKVIILQACSSPASSYRLASAALPRCATKARIKVKSFIDRGKWSPVAKHCQVLCCEMSGNLL